MNAPKNGSPTLRQMENAPSPISRVIAFGYSDGPTEGVLQVGDGGEVYQFSLIDELEVGGSDSAEVRLFGLSRLPSQVFQKLVDVLSPYSKPQWPVWVPVWRFPDDVIRQEVDRQVGALHEGPGAVAWLVATSDLLGTLRLVKEVASTGLGTAKSQALEALQLE